MRARPLALAASLAGALGCAQPPEGGGAADPSPSVALAWCVGRPFTPAAARGFDRLEGELVALTGSPGHSMQDAIATPGTTPVVHGKFAYGLFSKDLEGETVRVYLDDCRGWRSLGDAVTDGDGRVAFPVPGTLAIGVYDVRLEVLGDASVAPGRIWVLPRGTRLAVSDVDGTLTTGDEEIVQDVFADLYEPVLGGSFVPEAWPGAADLTGALAARGWIVVYLTGRPYWLTARTREWLSSGGFALGALHTTDSNLEALPTEAGVGAFKLAFLDALRAQGFVLEQAYGNATTDIQAYAGSGIPAASTWIIGPHAGEGGTRGVSGSWEPRAAEIRAGPAAAQPFAP